MIQYIPIWKRSRFQLCKLWKADVPADKIVLKKIHNFHSLIQFRSFNHRMYTVILMLCLNMCNVSQYRFCLCYFFKFILISHYHLKIQMHMMYIYKQGHQYTFLNLIWVEPLWLMTCVFSWCGVVFLHV